MKKIITMASSLVASMVLAASCGDEITGVEIPQGTVKLVLNDTNFVQLTNEEMTVLRTMGGQSTKISQKEAVDIAAKFLGKISLSKSAGSVRCDVLTRPSSKLSKSGTSEPDTLMYILNYGNNEGYALVCADKRVPDQVLAYSESGELDAQTDNLGVQMFLDMAKDYMDVHIAGVEDKRDSIELVLQEKFEGLSEHQGKHLSKSRTLIGMHSYDYWHGLYTTISERRRPMLRTYWGQGEPFNNLAPECKDSQNPCGRTNHTKRCPAGCTAVATGQLMAYFKWPSSVDGVYMNWNSMQFSSLDLEMDFRNDSIYSYRVSKLLRYIGDNIGMTYGCTGSGAWPEDAVNFLGTLGYYTYNMTGYNENSVVVSLRNTFPVMIYGYCDSTVVNGRTEISGGHTWLIDGYNKEITYNQTKTMTVYEYREANGTTSTEVIYSWSLGDETNSSYYFNCNWGWNGFCNGYFLSNVFDTVNEYTEAEREFPQDHCTENYMEGNYNSYSNGYYRYRLKIATNIHK